MVSFISIVHVVVKLKTFKVFRIDSASMKWPPFFGVCVCVVGGGALTLQILFNLAKILTSASLQ